MKLQNYLILMRLPFVTASAIPFLIGAGYVFHVGGYNVFNARFILGLCTVVCAHIAGNIFNDYFDSRSGNDWQDKREHIFFGGSKVIPRGLLTETEVFWAGMVFIGVAGICLVALQIMLPKVPILWFGFAALVFTVSYTCPPLKLAYRGWGELVIFILFGSAIVGAAYTVITTNYFNWKVIMLSLPISFLVTAILYGNEVPDYPVDVTVNKKNIVVRIGPRLAWIGYIFLIAGAIISLIICVKLNIITYKGLFLLPFFAVFVPALLIIKNDHSDLEKLKSASRFTIIGHTLVGAGMALVCFLR